MTEEEIKHLEKTVQKSYSNRKDSIWIKAFREYNQNNPAKRLGMGCPPCFAKVLFYHKNKVNEHTI